MGFGKSKRRGRRAVDPDAKRSPILKVRFSGDADCEQLTAALQMMIAKLETLGIRGVRNCALYLEPLGVAGTPMLARNHDGKVIETLKIDILGAPASPTPGVLHLSAPTLPDTPGRLAFNFARK